MKGIKRKKENVKIKPILLNRTCAYTYFYFIGINCCAFVE